MKGAVEGMGGGESEGVAVAATRLEEQRREGRISRSAFSAHSESPGVPIRAGVPARSHKPNFRPIFEVKRRLVFDFKHGLDYSRRGPCDMWTVGVSGAVGKQQHPESRRRRARRPRRNRASTGVANDDGDTTGASRSTGSTRRRDFRGDRRDCRSRRHTLTAFSGAAKLNFSSPGTQVRTSSDSAKSVTAHVRRATLRRAHWNASMRFT